MASPTNVLQWNPSKINQQTDGVYALDVQRTGGASSGIFPSILANKLFYQVTTVSAALCQMMVNKGYEMQDAAIVNLVTSLSNILTKAEFGTGANTVCQGNDDRLNAVGTKMWFYQNTAPTGWTIDTSVADITIAVKGGANAYNVAGGTQAGTWTPPNHNHEVSAHYHTTGSHTLTIAEIPSHMHNIWVVTDEPGTAPWTFGGGNNYHNVIFDSGATGGNGAHNHGNTSTTAANNTSASGTPSTYRPLAAVGIICTKN